MDGNGLPEKKLNASQSIMSDVVILLFVYMDSTHLYYN